MTVENDTINHVVGVCADLILSNETWKTLGFKKCPKYGAFFQRFRPKWKVNLEKQIIQETLAAFIAAYLVEKIVTQQDIPSIVAMYARPSVARALGYDSAAEAEKNLTQSITKYHQASVKNWAELLLKSFVLVSIPDKKLVGRLIVGCTVFEQNAAFMMLKIRPKT